MKRTILYVLILLNSFVLGQQGVFDQVTNTGGASGDYSYDIFVTDDGYTYITGKFKSTDLDFGNGITLATTNNYDMYLAKYDPTGNIVWAKQAGGVLVDEGRAIAVDAAGNVIVTGVFFNTIHFGSDSLVSYGNFDVFITKYDSDGNLLWAKQAHSSNQDKGIDIAIDNDDNYIITGYFGNDAVDTLVYEGTNIISNGERDIFVLKLYSDGSPVWGISGGGAQNDEATGVVTDKDNNIYISGYYKDTTAVFGNTTLQYEDGYELFLTKIDQNGNYIWAKNAYGPGNDRAYALDLSTEGDTTIILLTGSIEDTIYVGETSQMLESAGEDDIFVFAYTDEGLYIAGQILGADADDVGKSISFVPKGDGAYYIGGTSKSSFIVGNDTLTNYGKRDAIIFLMHQDSLVWMKNYGGSSEDYINSAVVDNSGNIYFTGNYKSTTAVFDTVTLTSAGGYDIWIGEFFGTEQPQLTVPTLFINEFLASNDSSYYDATTGKYPDWIEIYNAGDEAVDIGGMYITDDLTQLGLWQIPTTATDTTTIPAGGFLVLLADKKPEVGVLHINLKLGGSGEQIGLSLSDSTTIIDSLTFGEQTTDISMGRLPDSSSTWEFFSIPSPGASNSEGTVVGVKREDNTTLITKYELEQNYPNPFNPSTKIRYSLPNSEFVILKIYNILGREVATLVNEQQVSGNYVVSFNAVDLTSGIYFYQISTSKFNQVRKMLLLK